MRLNARRLLIGLPLVIAAIPVTYFVFLYGFGRTLVSEPLPATAPIPPLLMDALWAHAGGGRESELRPLNPYGLFRYVTCFEQAQHLESTLEREARGFECRTHLPAMQLREHLANQHVRANGIERNSFRGGAASLSTMLGFSGRWTRDDFLRTVAERAQFGHGWLGAVQAARGLVERELGSLTVAQAALVASRAGGAGPDPWCDAEAATGARNRVLTRMLENGAISEAQSREASSAPLGLGPPPSERRPCAR